MQIDLQAVPVNDLPPYDFAKGYRPKRLSQGPDEGHGQGSYTGRSKQMHGWNDPVKL